MLTIMVQLPNSFRKFARFSQEGARGRTYTPHRCCQCTEHTGAAAPVQHIAVQQYAMILVPCFNRLAFQVEFPYSISHKQLFIY